MCLLKERRRSRLEKHNIPEPVIRVKGQRTFIDNFSKIAEALGKDPDRLLFYLSRQTHASGAVGQGYRSILLIGGLEKQKTKEAITTILQQVAEKPEIVK